MPDKQHIADWFKNLQQDIVSALEEEDGGARFRSDVWERPGGGGGDTRVLSGGQVFEKGGVNFSAVYGEVPEYLVKQHQVNANDTFFATGVSIVIHPLSPKVPIIHMNVRYFEMSNGIWWFGGGIDLTPHYVVPEDADYFHSELKKVCDRHHIGFYPRFKDWADKYFFISHRKETRGIGGVFFDQLNLDSALGLSKQQIFSFVQDIGMLFAPVYRNIVQRHKNEEFTEKDKQFQLLRRGRYVEFNLVYDRGTRFGLETNGRVESILMSLPKLASWEYDFQVEPDSPEDFTLKFLRKD